MKQIWKLGLLGLLCLAIGVGAVEVKTKDSTKAQPPKAQPVSAKKPAPPPAQPAKAGTQPTKGGKVQPAEKKYDDFIDNNHNGIDDRKENLVKK